MIDHFETALHPGQYPPAGIAHRGAIKIRLDAVGCRQSTGAPSVVRVEVRERGASAGCRRVSGGLCGNRGGCRKDSSAGRERQESAARLAVKHNAHQYDVGQSSVETGQR